MILATQQNPLSVNHSSNSDRLLMAIDRGNSGCKIAVSVNGSPMQPFKIPSIVRRVDLIDGFIKIGKQGFICGNDAISMVVGTASTPLTTMDKVKDLSVVVAQAIQKISEVHSLTADLNISLVVSSPFPSETLVKEVRSELKPLANGFDVSGRTYTVTIDAVKAEFEGAVLLTSATDFNGIIDIGYGTILAAYKNDSNKILVTPLMGGDMGGCNLVLDSLLNDQAFITKVKATGVSALPSPERLSSRLSEGLTTLRGFDIMPMLKTHLRILKVRVENASASVRTSLRLSSEEMITPRIALVGGGACLLKLALSEEQLKSWGEKHHIEVFDLPDFQTALVMHQNAHMGGI